MLKFLDGSDKMCASGNGYSFHFDGVGYIDSSSWCLLFFEMLGSGMLEAKATPVKNARNTYYYPTVVVRPTNKYIVDRSHQLGWCYQDPNRWQSIYPGCAYKRGRKAYMQ